MRGVGRWEMGGEGVKVNHVVGCIFTPCIPPTHTSLLLPVTQHPNMSSVVVREVERLLHRPNISSKAQ